MIYVKHVINTNTMVFIISHLLLSYNKLILKIREGKKKPEPLKPYGDLE